MMHSSAIRRVALRCAARRSLSTPPGTVMVSIADAQSKTAQALRKIGWDEEDAASRSGWPRLLTRRQRSAKGRCVVCNTIAHRTKVTHIECGAGELLTPAGGRWRLSVLASG